jgi:8-oxo-dGTP diphosphatase
VGEEVHVVAGVLYDERGRVLIAQRPAGKALAGRWEFPGGKVADGEAPFDALVRELEEELGLVVASATPLMDYAVSYPGRTIRLDVWVVGEWSGTARGLDGQAFEWVVPAELGNHDILEADAPIIEALTRKAPGASS